MSIHHACEEGHTHVCPAPATGQARLAEQWQPDPRSWATCPWGQRARDVKSDAPCLPQWEPLALPTCPCFHRQAERTSSGHTAPWRGSSPHYSSWVTEGTPARLRSLAHAQSCRLSWGIQQKPPRVGALGDTKAMTWTQQPILASPKGLKGQGMTCWGVDSPARL